MTSVNLSSTLFTKNRGLGIKLSKSFYEIFAQLQIFPTNAYCTISQIIWMRPRLCPAVCRVGAGAGICWSTLQTSRGVPCSRISSGHPPHHYSTFTFIVISIRAANEPSRSFTVSSNKYPCCHGIDDNIYMSSGDRVKRPPQTPHLL